MWSHVATLLAALLAVTSVSAQNTTVPTPSTIPNTGQKLIGYFTADSSYTQFGPNDFDPSPYTHIKYAFADIDRDQGICVMRADQQYIDEQKLFPGDDSTCKCCVFGNVNQLFKLKQQYPQVETMLVVGGWTWSVNYSDVMQTPEARQKFASSCISIMLDYGMDGIDLDYEFPGTATVQQGTPGMIFRDDDASKLSDLLLEFRSQLDAAATTKRFLLSLDVAMIPWYLNGTLIAKMSTAVDWFSLMEYEMSLGSDTVRHNAQFDISPNDPMGQQANSVMRSVQWYLANGAKPYQLIVGVPAYGRQYTGTNTLFTAATNRFPPTYAYADVLAGIKNGTLSRLFDTGAKAAYAIDTVNKFLITYEDVQSIQTKANYVNDQQLGGMMVWQMSGDVQGSDSLMAAASNQLKSLNKTDKYNGKWNQPKSRFCNIQNLDAGSGTRTSKPNHAERFHPWTLLTWFIPMALLFFPF